MSESEALIRLQETDLKLMRLRARLAAMPQVQKLATIDRARKKLASELTTIVGRRKDAQMELEDNEHQHQDVVDRTAEVKREADERQASFRATRDLEAHLSALAKRQEKLEFRYLELAGTLERLEKAEHTAQALGERLAAERTAQEDSFHRESADLRAELRVLETERTATVAEISEENMARYTAASKRFEGLAVERLSGNMPSICRVKLQPADFGDLMRGPEIGECPYCHRILITAGARA